MPAGRVRWARPSLLLRARTSTANPPIPAVPHPRPSPPDHGRASPRHKESPWILKMDVMALARRPLSPTGRGKWHWCGMAGWQGVSMACGAEEGLCPGKDETPEKAGAGNAQPHSWRYLGSAFNAIQYNQGWCWLAVSHAHVHRTSEQTCCMFAGIFRKPLSSLFHFLF